MPSRKAKSVGMDLIPAAAEISCSASVSTLGNTMSGCASDACSNTGANLLHGPHQPAQKSTSTISCPLTVSQKVSPVSSCVATSSPIVGFRGCQRQQCFADSARWTQCPRDGLPAQGALKYALESDLQRNTTAARPTSQRATLATFWIAVLPGAIRT